MIAAGKLNTRAVLERPVTTQSAAGMVTTAWTVIAVVWAEIQSVSGRERRDGEQIKAESTHKLRIRKIKGLRATDRVLIADTFTNLNGGIGTTNTTIAVTDPAGTQGPGKVYALCGKELMQITHGQGTNTLTVVRGADGSTPAAAADGNVLTILRQLNIHDVAQPERGEMILLCGGRAD